MNISELLPPTVALNEEKSCLNIIDQTLLPRKLQIIELNSLGDVYNAIYRLQVRGAPAIGIAAAYGLYLALNKSEASNKDAFLKEMHSYAGYLIRSRPTAVNLAWAVNRLCNAVTKAETADISGLKQVLRLEAISIHQEDIATCKAIGQYGLPLIKDGFGVLTHCNAGHLATSCYGTALAPIYTALENNLKLQIYCDETRPLLQGARLTAFELAQVKANVTVLCDNMAAGLMAQGKVQAVFVGADRIAANGDTANKTGTLSLAINARYYNIPFYVCAPTSTIDVNCLTGNDIEIEHRPAEEISHAWYSTRMTPENIGIYNPAFDVTPASLITAIITENGLNNAPFNW